MEFLWVMASDFHSFLVEGSECMAISNRKGCKKQTTYKLVGGFNPFEKY